MTPYQIKWELSLLDAGHYIAQYRSYEGGSISRPKKWAESLENIKLQVEEFRKQNGNKNSQS